MSLVFDPLFVKPICGITFAEGVELQNVLYRIEDKLGPCEDRTPVFDFNFTQYYQEEMGTDLKKIFLSFIERIHPGRLPEIKKETNNLEETWSIETNRRVNIDPGYITGAKLILASTKDFAHRIFLADGIYGDVQLQFRQNRFRIQEWTYPDYQTEMALTFFHKVRKKYVREEKEHGQDHRI